MVYRGTRVLFLIAILFPLSGQEIRREAFNRYVATSSYTFDAAGPGQLIIDNVRGDITITGTSAMRAEISEIITIRTKSEERARKIADDVKATVRQTSGEGASLSIKITGRDRRTRSLSFDYVATLPEIFSVQARTRSGDITVENLQGEIDISTSGGDLELTHLSGKIFGKTSGGDIDCEDLGGRIVIVTSGGFIDMAEISGELNATTSGGDISVENIQGAVLVSTSGGDIDLADLVGREISATTSGGDITATDLTANTTIDLHTSGGNVEMEQIDGDIEASTSGGDIDMKEIRGAVKVWTSGGSVRAERILGALDARTSAGDIIVKKVWERELDDHEIDLKTSAGEIDLTLPRDFSASFSLRTISPSGKPGNAIVSDFPLEITASKSVARASGTNGNGAFDVRLETSVGGITISRQENR